jgi:hypothetical protein
MVPGKTTRRSRQAGSGRIVVRAGTQFFFVPNCALSARPLMYVMDGSHNLRLSRETMQMQELQEAVSD